MSSNDEKKGEKPEKGTGISAVTREKGQADDDVN